MLTKHTETTNTLSNVQAQVVEEKQARQTVYKRLSELKTEKIATDTSLREERLKTAEKEKEIESLKENLQAKKEREAEQARLASAQRAPVQETVAQNKPAPAVQVTGDKHSWLAASGIPEANWGHVDAIVTRESGWNPNAVNASSGACGLGQQLPCGKWAGQWNNPIHALRAMNQYVLARYGSWQNAVGFWNKNHWY